MELFCILIVVMLTWVKTHRIVHPSQKIKRVLLYVNFKKNKVLDSILFGGYFAFPPRNTK